LTLALPHLQGSTSAGPGSKEALPPLDTRIGLNADIFLDLQMIEEPNAEKYPIPGAKGTCIEDLYEPCLCGKSLLREMMFGKDSEL
jgi:hypothetical protein